MQYLHWMPNGDVCQEINVGPLGEVADAIRYLEEGHARGKVIITAEHNNQT